MHKVPPLRNYVFDQATKMVKKQTNGKYPAPFAILRSVRAGLEKGKKAGYSTEANEFSKLVFTHESEGLISLFHGTEAIKENRFGEPKRKVRNVAMLGSGLMGAGIAQVSAAKGMNVILYDVSDDALARGRRQIYTNLERSVKRRSMTSFERDKLMSRVRPVRADSSVLAKHLANCDLVIEAVPEKLELKHKVLSSIEKMVPEHCIIASNTSALPITDIASALQRKQNVLGMHYFSPVEKMPLLEIITTDQTSQEAASIAYDVGKTQGKQVIAVKDKAGFYTTRILAALMPEVAPLIAEGVDLKRLDQSLKSWGFPVGPITLIDEVGIDIGCHIGKDLAQVYSDRMGPASSMDLLQSMADKGLLGRKSNAGFFRYTDAKDAKKKQSLLDKLQGKRPVTKEWNPDVESIVKNLQANASKLDIDDKELQERLALRMVNEAVYCLEDGVLNSPVDGDIGAVFGLGFPPFYGGPFRYIDQVGADYVANRLDEFTNKYGPRFQPAKLLKEFAAQNKKFHKHF
mmetsp:Transcript_5570/g.8526  ORF Transcript_5570/g.8526 Transcript_5570/m.8526 type:complete len:517 (+) Transcript_5570:1823-3373(+)